MKPKLLFVIDSLRSGGAEKSLISLLSMLDFDTYDVDLFMFANKGLYMPLLPKEINVLEAPSFMNSQQHTLGYLIWHHNYKQCYLRVGASLALRNPCKKRKLHQAQITWKWIRKGLETLKGNYDIAIAYSQGHPTYFVAEKVRARKKICWINTDYVFAGYSQSYDRKYYKQFDNVVAVSDSNKAVFTRAMPIAQKKTIVMYDLISPAFIYSMASHQKGYQDDYQGFRILTIGRLVDVKGYDLAIKACSKLKKAGFDFKWYVIGEGPMKSKLKTMIQAYHVEDTFILLGTFQNPYAILQESDLYVQSSRYEGYGLAIAEARLLNVPVITTRFDAVYDQMIDKKNGLIVDLHENALYNGIVELMHNHELRSNIVDYLKKEKKGNMEEMNTFYQLLS